MKLRTPSGILLHADLRDGTLWLLVPMPLGGERFVEAGRRQGIPEYAIGSEEMEKNRLYGEIALDREAAEGYSLVVASDEERLLLREAEYVFAQE
jgi:hypothetical protein